MPPLSLPFGTFTMDKNKGKKVSTRNEVIAAIDFGSKNFKFLIGSQENGKVKTKLLKKEAMMLGKELAENDGSISDSKLKKIEKVLNDFKQYCKKQGIKTILGIGTSAVRSAKNNQKLAKLIDSFGISFEIARGRREGDIGYLAATMGKPNNLMSDMGSRSFQVSYNKKGEIVSQSLKAGYLIVYDKFYKNCDSFDESEKHLRKLLKHHIHHLPKHTENFMALASNSMAEFVTGKPKKEITNQFISQSQLRNKVKELKSLRPKKYHELKSKLDKANKILPGLTFIDYLLEFSHHNHVLIVESELPVGLIVEYFKKN